MNFIYSAIESVSRRQAARQPKAGEYRDENSGLIMCKTCSEPLQFRHKGFTLPIVCRCERENDAKEKSALEAYDKRQRQEQLNRGIKSEMFRSFTFDNDDRRNIELTKLCCRYVREFEKFEKLSAGLLFFGGAGGGKSFYSGCIANSLIKRDVPVLFTSLRELIDNRQAAKYRGAELIDLKAYRLFVLDDIGAEKMNRQDLDSAFCVVDDIYLLQRPLIVTTNLTKSQVEQPDDQEIARLYSRIRERAPKAVFVDNKEQNRLTAAKKKRAEMDKIFSMK